MTVQTSYVVDMVEATAGTLYGTSPAPQIESRIATTVIPFGVLVARRASPADGVMYAGVPNATADVTARPAGISLKDETRKNANGGYEINDPVRVLRKGLVWVDVETACTDGADVFVRFAAGTGTQLGAFRNDADTATAVALPGVKFRRTLAAAGRALVEINLP